MTSFFTFFVNRYLRVGAITLLILLAVTACGTQPSTTSIYAQPPVATVQKIDPRTIASDEWTADEVEQLLSLWIGNLPPLSPDVTNRVANNALAAEMGHRLFFDKSISANNQIACATCHIPDRYFTDGVATAHGTRPNPKNTQTIVGAGYAPWLFWNGRNDSLWSQAVAPFEAEDEHGSTRLHAVRRITNDPVYRQQYEALFGTLPAVLDDYGRIPDYGGPVAYAEYSTRWENMSAADQAVATQVFINMGKTIAAYERLLNPGRSSFDAYVDALIAGDATAMKTALDADAIAGLRLFIGKANCIQCHHGPLFSDFAFHNTGVPPAAEQAPAAGRALGAELLLTNEFNCASAYSDAQNSESCTQKLTSAAPNEVQLGALRTPMLRSVALTAPYMHAGQFATLDEVLAHYTAAPPAPLGVSEIRPLNLTDLEQKQLAAFLQALTSPIDAPPALLVAPSP